MLFKTYAYSLHGIHAKTVTIEVDISPGINFFMVGLPDSAVKESQHSIESALKANDFEVLKKRTVINMAPADIHMNTYPFSDIALLDKFRKISLLGRLHNNFWAILIMALLAFIRLQYSRYFICSSGSVLAAIQAASMMDFFKNLFPRLTISPCISLSPNE